MGATTSILRAAEDHALAACVLDSAFRDLRTVAEELVNRGRFPVPQFLLSWALEMIRTEVTARAAFDPLELMPIKCAPLAVCPAFFGVASDDTFVLPHHTQDLHNAWAGERVLRVFDGGHNGVRPTWFLEEAADFLVDRMRGLGGYRPVPSGLAGAAKEEEDDSSNEDPSQDGRPTPRLVSPISERLQLDADVAAGPVSSALSEAKVPRKKFPLAMELTKIGFSTEAVVEATRQCSTVEDALDWLHKQQQSGDAFFALDMRPPEGRVPPAMEVAAGAAERGYAAERARPPPRAPPPPQPQHLQQQQPQPRSQLCPRPVPSGPRRVGPPGATLAQQLRFLGFSDAEVDAASRRCLTLEAAMEWLAMQRVTVHL